jgi:PAS domain S-box-containing protein
LTEAETTLIVRPTILVILIVLWGAACALRAADSPLSGAIPEGPAGSSHAPAARQIVIGQPWSEADENQWVEVEGIVTFVSGQADGCELELSSEGAHMRVMLAGTIDSAPLFLLNSRVRVRGHCRGTYTSLGIKVAGSMTVAGWSQVELVQAAAEHWAGAQVATIGDLTANPQRWTNGTIVRVVGNYLEGAGGKPPRLQDAVNSIQMEGFRPPTGGGSTVEILGTVDLDDDGPVLVSGACRDVIQPGGPSHQDTAPAAATAVHQGAIGVGSWETSVQYSNIVVTKNGRVLYQSDFARQGAKSWRVYQGNWEVRDGLYQQIGLANDCWSTTGDTNWSDYTLTLRARKVSGNEGFLILFNWLDDNNWCWLNIGGWNNTSAAIEQEVNGYRGVQLGTGFTLTIATNLWYDIRIVLSGEHVQCYLDAKLIQDFTYSPQLPGPPAQTETLPRLTTAKQIHYLFWTEAARKYPVRLRGVVTSSMSWHNSFVMQDATHGIWVDGLASPRQLGIGEFVEVEGVTGSGNFAPIVFSSRVVPLGMGRMPEPIRPNRDQLLNGSLDAQYVEVQGVVTSVEKDGLTLLTLAGKYHIVFSPLPNTDLASIENALVRIKGCFYASWDDQTHQIKTGEMRLFDSAINVDEPAPADLFVAPGKTAFDLLSFDAKASALKRVKISGQIVHERAGEYFLMNGTNGLRFTLKARMNLALGDQVEVVGFPELGGLSPHLREAIARRTGAATLPNPTPLRADQMLNADADATLVRIESRLLSVHTNQTEQVLELQTGPRAYLARLALGQGLVPPTPLGSRLQLTGVYAGLGGDRAEKRALDSFELLLNSPQDVVVLDRPPWWTIGRALVVLGFLLVVLLLAIAWISGLRRQVNARTKELKAEIEERKLAQVELAYERDLLRVLLDNASDYIYFKDEKSRFIHASKSLSQRWNLSPEEIIGRTDFDLFLEEHARPALADELEIIRTGKPLIGKVERERHPDGQVTWVLTTKMPWRDADGKIIGTFGVSKDITEIKNNEDELRHKTALFVALLNASLDGILVVNDDGVTLVRNQQLCRLLKLPDTLANDTALFGLVVNSTRHPEAFQAKILHLRAHPGDTTRDEVEFLDGTMMDTYSSAVLDEHGAYCGRIWAFRDITAQKGMQREVEHAQRQLVDLSRQAGQAEVASSVLHNVGNVLNSVNVSTGMIVERVKGLRITNLVRAAELMESNREHLGRWIVEDARGSKLPGYLMTLGQQLQEEKAELEKEVHELALNMEHIKEIVAMQQSYARVFGVAETIALSDLVESALKVEAGGYARHGINILREFETVPPATLDRHRVLQILVNLLHNAKYACDESGRSDRCVRVQIKPVNGQRVRIEVADNGVGISPENLTRIFAHGFTTRKNGHGFGLHSAAIAAKELGGSLTVQSDGPGCGASFALEIPLQPDRKA